MKSLKLQGFNASAVIVLLSISAAGEAKTNCFKNPGRCAKGVAKVVLTPVTAPLDIATGKPVGTIAGNVAEVGNKAVKDTEKEAGRAVVNVGEAGTAIYKFVGSTVKGTGRTLSSAEQRLREGKVVDAIWHVATDPLKVADDAAAQALQESTILSAVAQTAATAYGGPGGAAAYAAWYAYKASGDPELSLKAGLLAGATSAGMAAVGTMPTDGATQITKKAIMAGAVGGLAVSAAGGDDAAVRKAFLLGGGMVLVQDGYKSYTDHSLDARASQGEAYCMSTIGADCSPKADAYLRDADGNIRMKNGKPEVDVTKTDVRRPHVGKWAAAGEAGLAQETGAAMTAVSRVPGMNAMSLFHDKWAVSWDMNAFTSAVTIVPAVVLTYTGTGAPLFDHLADTAVAGKNGSQPATTTQTTTTETQPSKNSPPTTTATPAASTTQPETQQSTTEPGVADQPTATQTGAVAKATATDIKAEASVYDETGALVGKVVSVNADGAIVNTGEVRAQIPLGSFGKNDKGLVISATKGDLDAQAKTETKPKS